MKTTAEQLLASYSDYINSAEELLYWRHESRDFVSLALLKAEAQHVTDVRSNQGEPAGGWKNEFPLEHSTALGHFFRACRTGNFDHLREQSASHPDPEIRARYYTLCNVQNAYVAKNSGMTTDQLIDYVATAMLDD